MTKRLPPKGDHQADLFAANFADIPIRDQRDTMERPFFSLAKKPRFTPIEYNVGDVWVEVSANPKFGIATIWDADILIWASTQITEALDRGQTAEPRRPVPPAQPAQIHPPPDRGRALPPAAGRPRPAHAHGRADQHPRRRPQESRLLPLAGKLDRGDRRAQRGDHRHDA